MRAVHRAAILFWLIAATAFVLLFWNSWLTWLRNGDPSVVTGYTLAGLITFLAMFNLRKRLSMIPLGRAAYWTAAHVVIGTLSIALFFLHTGGTIWPHGAYEQALSMMIYLVCLSGILGHWMQRLVPRRLTENGLEIIWERIPHEIAAIREEVEELVVEAAEKSASDSLVRSYAETFAWFFRRPRFLASHFFGFQSGAAFIRREATALSRYLDEEERGYLNRMAELAHHKNRVDFAYAVNGISKIWLLFHVPLAVGVLVLMIWHIILVHVYLL